MKTIRSCVVSVIATVLFVAPSISSAAESPDWQVSLNAGGSSWAYSRHLEYSDDYSSSEETESVSASGPSVGVVVKKEIQPEWTVDLSYSAASEFNILSSVTPDQSVQKASIELSHTKWWKYGYFGGGFGAGGAVFEGPGKKIVKEADCDDQLICFEPDEYDTVRVWAPGLAVNTDFGLRYGYAGLGLRTNAMLTTEGVAQMYYVHADVLF